MGARAWSKVALYERVLLNLKSGTAISGVLVRARGELLELKAARLHASAGSPPLAKPVALEGPVIVPHQDVDFGQIVPHEEV